MRKILVVLLACILLCGCSVDNILDKLPEKTYEHGDVSITLPNSFMDYSSQDMAEGKDFLFANSEMGIAGVREDKKELYEAFGEMDAEGYANLIAELYELDASAAEKDGHWSFTYEQEIDGEMWTYLCVFHETSTDYWNVQVYCKTSVFEDNEDTMWKYGTSVKFAEN